MSLVITTLVITASALSVCKYVNLFRRYRLVFEVLTLVPIQRSLIAPDLMSDDQLAWINAYHARVKDAVVPRLNLQSDGAVIDWLIDACKPLIKSK